MIVCILFVLIISVVESFLGIVTDSLPGLVADISEDEMVTIENDDDGLRVEVLEVLSRLARSQGWGSLLICACQELRTDFRHLSIYNTDPAPQFLQSCSHE